MAIYIKNVFDLSSYYPCQIIKTRANPKKTLLVLTSVAVKVTRSGLLDSSETCCDVRGPRLRARLEWAKINMLTFWLWVTRTDKIGIEQSLEFGELERKGRDGLDVCWGGFWTKDVGDGAVRAVEHRKAPEEISGCSDGAHRDDCCISRGGGAQREMEVNDQLWWPVIGEAERRWFWFCFLLHLCGDYKLKLHTNIPVLFYKKTFFLFFLIFGAITFASKIRLYDRGDSVVTAAPYSPLVSSLWRKFAPNSVSKRWRAINSAHIANNIMGRSIKV